MYAEGIKSGRHGIIGGQLRILNNEQLRQIDYAAKEILSQIGVKLPEQEALKILDEAGCLVDQKKERVWIPSYIVDEAVRKAPKGYKFGGRDPKKAIKLEGNRVYFAVGAAVYSIDVDGKLNKPTVKDEQDRIRVTDACENIDVAGAFRDITRGSFPSTPVEEMKLPAPVRKLVAYLRALDWTEKPIDMTQEYVWDRELQEQPGSVAAMDQINIGVALRGSLEELRKLPIDSAIDEPVSPLMHTKSQVERVLVYSKHGLPVWVGSEPMAGATSPVTLAGTLAQWAAECLSATVYSQMSAEPEHRPPVVWIAILGMFDQLSGTGPLFASPEGALMQSSCAQIGHYYGFPVRGITESASKLLDAQAGYETSYSLLMSAMSGLNYNTSTGVVGPGQVGWNLEKIVLDNDMIGYVKRVMRGINVSDETLAFDVIEEVGPGGTFIAHPHTRKWFRTETYYPKIFDRSRYQDWLRRGGKDAAERAHERVQEILRDHWPEPLDRDIRKGLEDYLEKVKKREAKKA